VPIHDQGYRRYGGTRRPLGRAWMVIARTGVRTLVQRRALLGLLLLAWVPFLVRSAQIYAAVHFPQAAFLAPTPSMFRQFLEQQEAFLFFVTIYAGAGLIANDRRANALQIYLSKPLTRYEYILGKLAVLALFLLFVAWLPAVLLLVVQVMFSGSFAFFAANPNLLPAITVFSVVQVLTIGWTMLALSSLSNNGRFVGVLYTGLVFFSQAMWFVLLAVTRDSTLAWISMPGNLNQIGDFTFGLPLRAKSPLSMSILVLGLIVAVSGFVLDRRTRGVEVVT